MSGRVIVLHERDNVGTAVADLEVGNTVEIRGGRKLTVAEAVPFGHKLAVVPIARGAEVIKYGESIGRALRDIPVGGYVHVEHVESQRGRGDLKQDGI